MRKTIKALILVIALAITSVSEAQGRYSYDNSFKYGPLSNLEVGASGMFSYSLAETHRTNWGAQLIACKRIGDYWRLRATAEVNGFANNGFDRMGKATAGVSFDILPFYVYGGYGINLNPGAATRFGIAADAGAGLQLKISNTGSLYMEAGVDRTNNGDVWQSNVSGKVGFMANLGITEADRQAIDIDNTVHLGYGELKHENQLLQTEVKKAAATAEQMQATLDRATALCEQLEKKLTNCQTEKLQAMQDCQHGLPPIYFEYASSFLTPIEEEKVALIAETINADNVSYSIEGYCSANGDPYRNQKLSEERAYTVFYALVANGVNSTRLVVAGHGMTDRDSALEQRVVVRKLNY